MHALNGMCRCSLTKEEAIDAWNFWYIQDKLDGPQSVIVGWYIEISLICFFVMRYLNYVLN